MIIDFIIYVLSFLARSLLTMFSFRWLEITGITIFTGDALSTFFGWIFGLITFFQPLIDLTYLVLIFKFYIGFLSVYWGVKLLFFIFKVIKFVKFW